VTKKASDAGPARRWFESNIGHGWASCPLTQNGCLRVMSQPGYSNPLPLAVLSGMLQRSTDKTFHKLWGDDISILDAKRFNHSHIHSPRQLTDLYLLGLAVKHKGRLASFEQRIPLSAVVGATPAHLVTL
jgi:predicted nucleic acid-binding protein